MYVKTFAFCGLTVRFETGEPTADNGFFPLFRTDGDGAPDYRVRVLRGPLPNVTGETAFEEKRRRRVICCGEAYDYTVVPDPVRWDYVPYACAVRRGEQIDLYIDWKDDLWDSMLFEALDLPDLFLEKGVGILHASHIAADGRAVLFAGPAQIGKSTQASLWETCRRARVVNGDRAGVGVGPDGVTAYGLPFCGTSGVCRNEQRPVKAIVFPLKSGENAAARLPAAEAFRRLLGCLSYTRAAPAAEKAVSLAERLAVACPCFLLRCRPDEGAVTALADAIGDGGA